MILMIESHKLNLRMKTKEMNEIDDDYDYKTFTLKNTHDIILF